MNILLSTIEAIIGLKIKECDLQLALFPDNAYAKGARDQAVNLLTAIREASK